MIDTARHVAYLLKVQAVDRAFTLIDNTWPKDKFPIDNAYWTREVYAINGNDTLSNEEKTRQLHLLIDTIKGR